MAAAAPLRLHLALLRQLIAQEWRHHPGRVAVVWLAILLGVALAFAVHLINSSALAEFGQAVRSVNGQPDAQLRPVQGAALPEALYPVLALLPMVRQASPVVEVQTACLDAQGRRQALRVVGIDALATAGRQPGLLPIPAQGAPRDQFFDPDRLYLNAAARALVGAAQTLRVQAGAALLTLPIGGTVAAEGPPLAVIDIAGAQAHFGQPGLLSRVDVWLQPGSSLQALQQALDAVLRDAPAALATTTAATWRLASADESAQRLSNLSRAYRVNLTVLSLVALFTGAFLVFSVQSLAVAKRIPQLALLGVLGMDARTRLSLILSEAAALGVMGALAGLALGTGLAALALQLLGGDLGSGLLGSAAPPLQWSWSAAALYGGLGVVASLAGSWLPAHAAARIAPAQSLKGLGDEARPAPRLWPPLGALAAAALLALLPAWGGLPLAAYGSVVLLLLGGIALVPALVGALLSLWCTPRHPIWLLAVERARDQRATATIAVAGVVASLALSVALTVMVASFRDSVSHWLEQVLPADLYARTATTTGQAEALWLDPAFLQRAAALPGVARLETQRLVPLPLDPAQAPVTLIARPLSADAHELPLLGALQPTAGYSVNAHEGVYGVYISEPMASLYHLGPGEAFSLPLPDGRHIATQVRGLWRDYARQQGALVIDRQDWLRLTGDARVNDLALWLAPGADVQAIQVALRRLVPDPALLELSTPAGIRAVSLQIFDRSFAVTYWLQAVAIAIGLAGVAASVSSQVLARRREFGALQHLGFSRRQVLTLVVVEGAIWTTLGTLLGLALGWLISLVLVKVVNPQSFHWTMELSLPAGKLAALAVAEIAAGCATSWWAGRAAGSHRMALAVKEDW
jgi:putative ABC transport system permease protein